MSEDNFDVDLFNYLVKEYQGYEDICDKIYNLEEGDVDKIFEEIINYAKAQEVDFNVFFYMINEGSMCRHAHLRAYYQLYLKLKEHFQAPHFRFFTSRIHEILENLDKPQKIEKILDVQPRETIHYLILHDDILAFRNCYAEKNYDLKNPVFNGFYEMPLIGWACRYGAVKCYKFLRSNNVPVPSSCLRLSILGQNNEIINELMNIFTPDDQCLECALEIHNFELAMTLYLNYGLEINYYYVAFNFNLKFYFFLLSQMPRDNSLFGLVGAFGIPKLAEYLHGLGFNINGVCWHFTALMHAADRENIKTIEKLIELGADIDQKDEHGNTALIHASVKQNDMSALKLIDAGAQFDIRDRSTQVAFSLSPIIYRSASNLNYFTRLIF